MARVGVFLGEIVKIAGFKNDEHFQTIISAFIESGIMSEGEMADFLLVSCPTVNRWSRGISLPRIAMRQAVLETLVKKLGEI